MNTAWTRWAAGAMALAGLLVAASGVAADGNGAPDPAATNAVPATEAPRETLDAVQWQRVRRLAPTWSDARMDVLTRSGSVVSGRFRGLHDASLVVAPENGGPQRVPVRDLARITLRRQPSDVALAAVMAIGVAGLFGAVGTLGVGTEGGGTVALAAGGALVGAGIGWRTVCRERVIAFD